MSIDLAVQKALRTRITTTAALMQHVPADNVLDTNQRPSPVPSIILGESQSVDEGTSLRRAHTRVYHTVHVWTREASTEQVKVICGEIRCAIGMGRLELAAPLHCADLLVSSMRFLRDLDGEHAHGVVTVEVLVTEDRT